MLTKDSTPYDLNTNFSPKSSLKRYFTISYDVNATDDFPNIPNKKNKSKQKQKPKTRTREALGNTINTPTSATINNDDSISILLDENNKTEQANVTKLISDNNKSFKQTFLQILEDNNNKIKIDIIETLKQLWMKITHSY